MTPVAHGGLIAKYVAALPDRLDIGPPLYRTEDGRVAGRFLNARVSSVFQPVVDLHRQLVVGHQGLLRVEASGNAPLAPWSLFALAASDAMLRHLDRLCRTLHTLNYFAEVDDSQCLYLNVEQRLLASVPDEHGKVFESILAKFGLSPRRIVIVFPRSVAAEPALLAKGARNYRARGYRVMVPVNSADERMANLFPEAAIDLVKVDVVSGLDAQRLGEFALALGERGISVLAGKVESAELLRKVIDADVDFVQGFVLGPPAALAGRRLPQFSRVVPNAPAHPERSGLGGDSA